jgi:hypothetical protein
VNCVLRASMSLVCVFAVGLPSSGQPQEAGQAPETRALIEQLRDPSPAVRSRAASLLAKLGSGATPAVPYLTNALRDPDKRVRFSASLALGAVGPGAAPAVPALIAARSDPDESVRVYATRALGQIGPSAAALSVPVLVAALGDYSWPSDPESRIAIPGEVLTAASALAELGPTGVRALVGALSSPRKEIRWLSASVLARNRPVTATVLTGLVDLVRDQDKDVSKMACFGVKEAGLELKSRGTILYWVVPRAFWRELIGLLAFLVTWFTVVSRYSPRWLGTGKRLLLGTLCAVVPALSAGSAIRVAASRDWAQGFIPGPVLTVLSFPDAAALSVAFACVLTAVWACQGTIKEHRIAPRPGAGTQ